MATRNTNFGPNSANLPKPPSNNAVAWNNSGAMTPMRGPNTNLEGNRVNNSVKSHNWATSNSWTGYVTNTQNSIVNSVTEVTNSNVFLSIMVVVGMVLLAIIGYVFYKEYQQTRSYVGEVTGTQYARGDPDVCKPYIRCIKEEGQKWFRKVDDYKLCEICTKEGKCADYINGGCKPGNCKKDECDSIKPPDKPCSGFLQKSAPHCDIGNVYSLQKAHKATDVTASYLPFNFGSESWWPQNPFQRIQSYVFS